jgi:hypothetical protein
MFMRKVTGYVSYVRGENPYTFPFRVYPDIFAPMHTFKTGDLVYPTHQINLKKIKNERKMNKLILYVSNIGEYQQLGYNYIVQMLRNKQSQPRGFGYTELQIPIEALNIVYPYDGLEEMVQSFTKNNILTDEYEEDIDDISPVVDDTISPTKNSKRMKPKKLLIVSDSTTGLPEPQLEEEEDEDQDKDKEEYQEQENPPVTEYTQTQTQVAPKKRQKYNLIIEDEDSSIKEQEQEQEQDLQPALKPRRRNNLIIEDESVEHIIQAKSKTQRKKKKKDVKEKGEKKKKHQVTRRKLVRNKDKKGGAPGREEEEEQDTSDNEVFIDAKELTGVQGLNRIMSYTDTKSAPAIKGEFEYRREMEHIFAKQHIGKYSSKIKSICDAIYKDGKVSEGIILIYSSYIDGGIIPMALALEEMGFSRYR